MRVVGPPNVRIQVHYSPYDDGNLLPLSPTQWVETDAAGRATAAPGVGVDLRVGDRVPLTFLDRAGNVRGRSVQNLPPAP